MSVRPNMVEPGGVWSPIVETDLVAVKRAGAVHLALVRTVDFHKLEPTKRKVHHCVSPTIFQYIYLSKLHAFRLA